MWGEITLPKDLYLLHSGPVWHGTDLARTFFASWCVRNAVGRRFWRYMVWLCVSKGRPYFLRSLDFSDPLSRTRLAPCDFGRSASGCFARSGKLISCIACALEMKLTVITSPPKASTTWARRPTTRASSRSASSGRTSRAPSPYCTPSPLVFKLNIHVLLRTKAREARSGARRRLRPAVHLGGIGQVTQADGSHGPPGWFVLRKA